MSGNVLQAVFEYHADEDFQRAASDPSVRKLVERVRNAQGDLAAARGDARAAYLLEQLRRFQASQCI